MDTLLINSTSFAVDTPIYIANKNIDDLCIDLYNNLVMINDWYNANELLLNLKKTNYILLQPSRKIRERDIPIVKINNDIQINRS